MKAVLQSYLADLVAALGALDHGKLEMMADKILATRHSKSTVFLIGNGGCAAAASHSACDWGRELGVRTVSIADNTPSFTAHANDFGYEMAFRRQLDVYLSPGDLLVAYSGSGNSPNIISAVELARSRGNFVIGVSGDYRAGGGGKLAQLADLAIVVASRSMERIEDVVLITNHVVREYMHAATNPSSRERQPA